MRDVRLTPKAERDFRKIRDARARRDVARFLSGELTADPHPDNVDIKAIAGCSPWLRGRCGEHRIIFRPLSEQELRASAESNGYLVARIIDRRELDRAIPTLPGL